MSDELKLPPARYHMTALKPYDRPGEHARFETGEMRSTPNGGELKDPPPRSQAQRVIDKFGGPRRLAALLRVIDPPRADGKIRHTPSSVYRWTYPRERGGTAGRIPAHVLPLVMKAARLEGIFLTPDDLYPGMR